MSDPIRYQIHLRRLNQIKQRNNLYPVYNISMKSNRVSPRKMKIDKLSNQIKKNNENITIVKKSFEKKKPGNYQDDIYLYDREVKDFQKKLLNQLIKNNNHLKKELKQLKGK